MSLNFPISLVGKREAQGYEYTEPCADSITDPALTHVFYSASCTIEATYEGTPPSNQYNVRNLGGSNFNKRVYFGTSCTHTGGYTFYGDAQLYGNLIFPENVEIIGYQCFFNCTKIAGVTFLGNGLRRILGLAFQGVKATGTLSIPSSIEDIQGRAFRFSTFNRIEIHAVQAPTISTTFTFAEMPNVTEIHVPSNATGYAASYNGLTVVYDLPAG